MGSLNWHPVLALVLLPILISSACTSRAGAGSEPVGPQLDAPQRRAVVEAAEASYRAGDYASAIAGYQLAVAAGQKGPEVQANLGSACLAAGRLGCASLAYYRASSLAPRDPEIHRRLEALRARVPEARRPAGWSWLRDRVAFDEVLRGALAIWLIVGLAMLLLLHAPRVPALRRLLRIGLLGLCLLIAFGLCRWTEAQIRPAAVVLHPAGARLTAVPVPDPPLEQGDGDLTVGAWVRIIDARAGYVLLRSAGGKYGWAPKSAIESIGIP